MRKKLFSIWVLILLGVVSILLAVMLMGDLQTKIAHSKSSVYYGVDIKGVPSTFSKVTSFETDVGESVAIVMWYQGWGATDGTQNFQSAWMDVARDHGSIPLVTWEPRPYLDGTHQPAFALRNIISGSFDSYITKWAQDSKAWGYPYFLRFAHEMNGNWYPWSEQVNANQPGEYVKAWRHVHDIFVANGATNVTWVWSPNVESPDTASLVELYPGDSYVDWVGMDGYNWGTSPGHFWQTFSQLFSQTYNDLQQIAPAKALMVGEIASAEEGGSKAQWITDAYSTQLPTYFPRIKAIIWFNENKEADWRIESSSSSQQAFTRAVRSPYYADNQFGSLGGSPILPLLPLSTTRINMPTVWWRVKEYSVSGRSSSYLNIYWSAGW